MSPDTYLILLELNEPRASLGGHPSIPDIERAITFALKRLYEENHDTARINFRLWSSATLEWRRQEMP